MGCFICFGSLGGFLHRQIERFVARPTTRSTAFGASAAAGVARFRPLWKCHGTIAERAGKRRRKAESENCSAIAVRQDANPSERRRVAPQDREASVLAISTRQSIALAAARRSIVRPLSRPLADPRRTARPRFERRRATTRNARRRGARDGARLRLCHPASGAPPREAPRAPPREPTQRHRRRCCAFRTLCRRYASGTSERTAARSARLST